MAQRSRRERSLRVMGSGTWPGGAYRRVSVLGDGQIEGDLQSPDFKVLGEIVINGSVSAKTARVIGTCSAKGTWSGDVMNLTGELTVHGDCSVEQFKSNGVFDIRGLLNAGHVSIRLHGPSRVREIGGETIKVRRWAPFLKPSCFHQLVAETIEGDEVHLQYTKAKVVRGNKVIVGRGCEIDLVEYHQGFLQRGDAVVSAHRKV